MVHLVRCLDTPVVVNSWLVSAETLSKDTTEFPGILVPTFRGDFA
jgi:hypothetical protein